MENEEKIRFVSNVAHPTKKFSAKRPFGQQWNNQGKQAHTMPIGEQFK
jgi:hypothetical protein